MSRMWEVDPETRAKLLQISKTNANDRCCDCNAPSPQWASPKFGIFICLNCAGTHRGLGVHISFVRSITMDAFKTGEIHRMEQGGNEPWKSFFDNHAITQSEGRTFEDSTIKERYEGEVGEEWKERLAAKVEGREYVPGQREVKKETPAATGPSSISNTGPRRSSPALSEGGGGGKKERNEAYFAKLGTANATRSESLPPSQGGKFTGFGGGLPPSSPAGSRSSFMGGAGGAPALDDFQKDPMGTLTKGFGWFTSAVGKSAKTVHDSYIQPTAKQLAESDFAAQARLQATHLGQNIQVGARGAADQFNRFVEGQDEHTASLARRRGEPERKDFWDDFAALGAEGQGQGQGQHRRSASRPNAIGTAAMKPGATGAATGTGASGSAGASGSGGGGGATGTAKGQGQQHEEGWDEDW